MGLGVIGENDRGEDNLPLAVPSRPGIGKAGILDVGFSVIGASQMYPTAKDDGIAVDALERSLDGVRVVFQTFAGYDFEEHVLIAESAVAADDQIVICH